MLKLQQQADIERNEVKRAATNEIRDILKAKEKELQDALVEAEKEKQTAIDVILNVSSTEKSEMVKLKEEEMIELINIEKEKVESRMKEDMNKMVIQIRNEEKKKVDTMKDEIERINLEHSNNVQVLHEEILQTRKACDVDVKSTIASMEKKADAAIEMKINEMKKKFEQDKIQILLDQKETVETVRCEAKQMLEDQLRLCKEEESKKLEKALYSMSQEYDEHIQSLEYDLSWEKSQKQSAVDETNKIKIDLEEMGISLQELTEALNKERKRYSLKFIHLIANAFSSHKAWQEKVEEINLVRIQFQEQHEEREQDLKKKIKVLEKRSIEYERRMKLVASTLLNHKRNELIEHKTKSRDMAKKIQRVTSKINAVQSKRDDLMNILSHLEDEMKMVELQLQEHSQTSAIQGGKINQVHARKKRRLDEE